MIYGNIHAKETEAAYAPMIRRALDLLRTTDLAALHEGRYPIDGDKLVLVVNEFTTGPKETRHPEAHREHIDVQYIFSGREAIGCYPNLWDGPVHEDRMAENDVLFYEERDDVTEVMLPLTEGCYGIFFPEDAHRPGCMIDGPEPVKKIVLKIRVDAL